MAVLCPLFTQGTWGLALGGTPGQGCLLLLAGLFACSVNVLEAQLCLPSEQVQWLREGEAGPLPSCRARSGCKCAVASRAAQGHGWEEPLQAWRQEPCLPRGQRAESRHLQVKVNHSHNSNNLRTALCTFFTGLWGGSAARFTDGETKSQAMALLVLAPGVGWVGVQAGAVAYPSLAMLDILILGPGPSTSELPTVGN